ncbi:acyl-CoA carboxylase subunit beta [Streptomyces sp. NPDC056921]|uniref:acyl-CoA carboxylase subunit beta n=1 Tax=Streptomyces sp. NPDC056921 TaxID=3345966 RepID=UPI003645C124
MAVRERENAVKEFQRRQGVVIEQAERSAEIQQTKGKLSARERVLLLLDPGSFVELDALSRSGGAADGDQEHYGDGVITGYGTVDGRPVCVFSQDATYMGGSLGEVHARRILKVMDLALRTGQPIVGINDGAGARIQEGVVSQALYAEIFQRNVKASGVIPQISLVMGYCAGGAAYSPALTDFVVMVDRTSHMFITGPDVVKAVTGEDIGVEELGGARTHNAVSGNAHYSAADEQDAIDYVKDLLSFLPDNNLSFPREYPGSGLADDSIDSPAERRTELDSIVPTSPTQPYDMRDVIEEVVDEIGLVEVQEAYAQNIITGFSRIEGASVGIVASQPLHLAGCLDINASEKAARFVRTCNAFNIPVLTFVDVPGFLPGTEQEWTGIIRRGAKLIYAYAEATVPLVTVITRKAYGAGYDVLGSKHLGADVNLAWPAAEIAVMGAEGATNIVHRKKLAAVLAEGGDVDTVRDELRREYEDRLCNPYVAAERGYIDAVIQPSSTRSHVARALRMLRNKRDPSRTERGNMPL